MPNDPPLDFLVCNADDYREILDAGGIGLWEYDPLAGRVRWSARISAMLGHAENDAPTSPKGWFGLVHPEDRSRVRTRMEAALALENPRGEARFRMRRSDGRWLWVHARGRVIERDAAGRPLRAAGTLSDLPELDEMERVQAGRVEHPRSVSRDADLARDMTARQQGDPEFQERHHPELEFSSEPKTSVRERMASEGRFRYAINASNVGLWDWDIQSGVVYFSAAFAATLDAEPGGRALIWEALLHPDDHEVMVAHSERYLREAGECELECRMGFKDRGYRWVLSRGKIVEWDAAGEPQRALGTVTDIDDMKRAERMNRKLAAIIEASGDLITAATPEGCLDYINRAGRALLGFGELDSLDQFHLEDLHPAWAYQRIRDEAIPAALAQGRWLGDTVMVRRDGSEVSVSQLLIAQKDPATGQVEFLSAICRDLSERIRADEALRISQDDLNRAQAVAKTGSWRLDVRRNVLTWSAENYRIFGISPGTALTYETFLAAVHPEDRDTVDRMWRAALQGEPYDIEHRVIVDGRIKWLRQKAELEFDERGELLGGFGTTQDITERKQSDDALREADRRKDEFIAILGHELRNPLAPIKSAAQILARAGLDDAMLAWSREVIERQVDHLTQLVDDLLDISRISRGKITLHRELLVVADIVQRAVEISRPLIDARQHELSLCLPSETLHLEGDLVRLSQVVANLLNNAATYTEPGGRILLAVQPEDGEVVLRVKDSGVGISSSMLDQVFDLFVQMDESHRTSPWRAWHWAESGQTTRQPPWRHAHGPQRGRWQGQRVRRPFTGQPGVVDGACGACEACRVRSSSPASDPGRGRQRGCAGEPGDAVGNHGA